MSPKNYSYDILVVSVKIFVIQCEESAVTNVRVFSVCASRLHPPDQGREGRADTKLLQEACSGATPAERIVLLALFPVARVARLEDHCFEPHRCRNLDSRPQNWVKSGERVRRGISSKGGCGSSQTQWGAPRRGQSSASRRFGHKPGIIFFQASHPAGHRGQRSQWRQRVRQHSAGTQYSPAQRKSGGVKYSFLQHLDGRDRHFIF
ncbi:hypothetical protein E2C01_051876 [Portunus trituberculatus]|uniref:Uncharacterized protein n=1 Tax=Portunus trituberculatus TaxID=210409 RepID=A0A5B7GK13_PORTR|nr:hypothetical protein [Portunus trituberculatus]